MEQKFLPFDEYNELLKKLSVRARLLYNDILKLSKNDSYCIATDVFFCNLYKICRQTIWRAIATLEKHQMIERSVTKNKDGYTIRKIIPLVFPKEKSRSEIKISYENVNIGISNDSEHEITTDICTNVHTSEENGNCDPSEYKKNDFDKNLHHNECTINGTETFMVHSPLNSTKNEVDFSESVNETKTVHSTQNRSNDNDKVQCTENGAKEPEIKSESSPEKEQNTNDHVAFLKQPCCNFETNHVAFLKQPRCNFETQDRIINKNRYYRDSKTRGRALTSVDLIDENGKSIVLPNPYKDKEDGYHG